MSFFLKAPGGQFFYQGQKPPFHGQEKVTKVVVIYREEFFDSSRFLLVKEEKLKELDISL